MYLTKEEEKMYQGEYGDTVRKSMEIIVALGDIYGAEKLVDISSAQISGVSYKTIGDAGLEYLEDLANDKEIIAKRVVTKIPSTLNPAGTDLDNWEKLSFPAEFALKQNDIVDAYGALGISKTCTCTPYLVGNIPKFKDHVAWSESSAVCYANSVIGARTNREGGPSALAAAICGKTSLYGYHLENNRKTTVIVELNDEISGIGYGALGYLIGKEIGDGIPYFILKNKSTNDELKSLGAALASSGAVALYHIENETPEYDSAGKEKLLNEDSSSKINLNINDIEDTCKNLTNSSKDEADLVCLGCPHASLEEIKDIANLVNNKRIKNELWVCTSINIKAASDRMGYTKVIESAGGHIVCDTCMVVAPIEDMGYEIIGVDSAKAANYIPSMCGLEVIYDNAKNLIKFE